MSKSVLPIFIKGGGFTTDRHVEIPCRMPDALSFEVAVPDLKGVQDVTFWLKDGQLALDEFECHSAVVAEDETAIFEAAESILATIKATLGITSPVPPGSPLPAIALAYEAECASFDACTKAHRELPRAITGEAMYWLDPRDGNSAVCRMLAKYVEHVVENAAKVTP